MTPAPLPPYVSEAVHDYAVAYRLEEGYDEAQAACTAAILKYAREVAGKAALAAILATEALLRGDTALSSGTVRKIKDEAVEAACGEGT